MAVISKLFKVCKDGFSMRVFETRDKSGRYIYLTDERWKHINEEHPEVAHYLQELENTILNPTKITSYEYNDLIKYYYKYFKHKKGSSKYFLIIVKYLNGEGYIITAYFVRYIK